MLGLASRFPILWPGNIHLIFRLSDFNVRMGEVSWGHLTRVEKQWEW